MIVPENVLEIGLTENGYDVVVNHPKLITDDNGYGHIIFSPAQAREFAKLLIKKADLADSLKAKWEAGNDSV